MSLTNLRIQQPTIYTSPRNVMLYQQNSKLTRALSMVRKKTASRTLFSFINGKLRLDVRARTKKHLRRIPTATFYGARNDSFRPWKAEKWSTNAKHNQSQRHSSGQVLRNSTPEQIMATTQQMITHRRRKRCPRPAPATATNAEHFTVHGLRGFTCGRSVEH